MAILGSATYKLDTDNARLNRGMAKAEQTSRESSKRIAGNMAKIGAAGVAMGAAVGFALFKVGKGAFELEQQFAEVRTLLPKVGDKAFGALEKDVIALSNELGMAAQDVIPALYQAISAGVPTENVISFLRTSGKAAIGGVSDLTTAVDGISSVVNAYADSSFTAANASDLMFTAVRLGKTTFNELSGSLFNAVPVAASLGIGFDQITASLAAMTAQGVPTKIATTGLRQLFVELSKDGMELADVIQNRYGKSLSGLMDEGRDFTTIMNEIAASMPADEFRNMFSSVEAMNAAMVLVGPGGKLVADALAEMRKSAGATDKAFQIMADTAGFKLSRAVNQMKNTFKVAFMTVLPVIEELLPWVQAVVTQFTEWAERNPKWMRALVIGAAAVTVLTLAIGGALLALAAIIMIAPFAAVAWGIALGPVGWIALAVIALIGLIVLLWVKWDWLMEKFGELSTWQKVAVVIGLITVPILNIILAGIWLIKNWDKVKAKALAIWDGLKAAWGWVSTFVSNWYAEILAILFPVVGLPLLVRKHWGTIWDSLGTAWDTAWRWIEGVLTSAWDGIKTAWDASWGWVEDEANIWDGVKAAWSLAWGGIKWVPVNAWAWIKTIWDFVWGGIKSAVEHAWDGVKTAWNFAWGGIKWVAVNAWAWIKTIWDFVWGGIKSAVEHAWDGVKTAWNFAWGGIKWAATTAWDGIKAAWNFVWPGIKWAAEHTWDGISAAWSLAWGGIKWVATTAWDGIKAAWNFVWPGIKWAVAHAWDGISAAWETAWGGIKGVLASAWDGIKVAWNTIFPPLRTAALAIWNGVSAVWETAWGGIKTAATNAWDALKLAWDTVIGGLRAAALAIWNGVSAVWETAWGGIKTAATEVWDELVVAWDTVSGPLKEGIKTIWNGIDAVWTTAWGGMKSTVKGALNIIIGWINKLIGAWNGIAFRVPTITLPSVTLGGGSFLGVPIPRKTVGGGSFGGQTFSTPNIAQIPILDSGAVVTGPTIAGLAMNNRPEAVVPLDRAGGLGLTVNVYLDGATILEADDAEQYIVDMVDRAVRRGVVLGST